MGIMINDLLNAISLNIRKKTLTQLLPDNIKQKNTCCIRVRPQIDFGFNKTNLLCRMYLK